ncbi:type V secretory pathway, adhesin AidA [Stutzerimonas stutzeri]|nr:type V secretory pathway, adhesin AidA [Stutzerimonas stutzeri]
MNFNIGEIEGQFDSSMSIGASWSTTDRDMDLVGAANGGTGFTQTGDDGRLNFKKGETFSKIFKGVHDLELRYRDSGAFVRGKYWYDFELKDESRLFKDISDSNRKEAAQSSGAQILDAFLYHNYSVGDLPGTVRLGKQVVSWGESTFIGNSINSINPLDAAAFRRPGAEIKEGLIPVNMFYISQSLSDRLSMEAFYQLEWDQTILDNCGTFFSGADVAADGCDTNYHVGPAALAGALNSPLGAIASQAGVSYTSEGVMIPRGGDRDARDSGQFGLALRWLGDSTEYGAYFMNYHSRTPIVSTRTADSGTFAASGVAGAAAGQAVIASVVQQLVQSGVPLAQAVVLAQQIAGGAAVDAGTAIGGAVLLGNGQYFLEYPEDIRLYGLSFSTTLPTGTAWSGEISYRPNAPIQINTTDVTTNLTNPARAGMENRGYNRKEITQLQTTFTHFFDQVLGAGRVTVVGEIGYAHVGGLESTSEIRYGRDAIFGTPADPLALAANGRHGFVTANSWGYRLRAIADYNNVFAGINLKPNLSFSHDVDGYGPNGLFNEGSKAVSIGLDAEYQNMYTASLSYTDFFGGDYNTLVDRDFLAFSVGVNF